ncbi:hypothetical protein EON65_09755 [archaeon]|nr:MAG: hypothetical protein EON65_09755 [archaeon]
MFQANQRVVAQEANLNLVNIRYMEIQYFTNFFGNFGTQCFILAGLIGGSISQVPQLNGDATCPYFFVILYNSNASACVALATMSLLGSVFICVYGEGLAIRGPLGSLVKVIDGMVQEQRNAVALFVGTMVTFVLQMVGMSWIMMDQGNAVAATAIMLCWGVYTYRSALRIYNRFWWDKNRSDWKDEVDQITELNDLSPTIADLNSTYGSKEVEQAYRVSLHRGYLTDGDSEVKKRSVLSNILKTWYKSSEKSKGTTSSSKQVQMNPMVQDPMEAYYDNSSVVSDSPYMEISDAKVSFGSMMDPKTSEHAGTPAAALGSSLKAGGFLALKSPRKGLLTGSHPWERRYFIIKNTLVFYYKDKRSFELSPSKPLNQRAIELEGYFLKAGKEEPPFVLSLVPKNEDDMRKNWVFRADTVAEFRTWKDIFLQAIAAANRQSS